MFHRRLVILVAALALLAGRTAAAPSWTLAKPGGGYEAWKADLAQCHAVASRARIDDLPPGNSVFMGPVTGDMTTVVGATIAFALIGMVETSHQRRLAVTLCMRNLGYAVLPLTAQETAVYQQLSGSGLDGWQKSFLEQDLTARMSAALTPAVPRLPPYRDEPLTQGGLKLDAGSLAPASGPVDAKGVVLTGKASRWRTAVLAEPFETTAGFIDVAGAPGAVFYQADVRPQREPLLRQDGATWCGPVTQTATQGAPSREVYCFTGRDDGYEVYQTSGYDWFGGAYGDGFTLPRFNKPIVLNERADDDLGPLDFEVRAITIKHDFVDLEGVVRRRGDEVAVWDRRLKFDAGGSAVLPLWTRRLVLTRTGAGSLNAALDANGDGHGWREGD
ncbi:MAG: hypothetical protein ACHP84_11280 [Caulobacterales bacterium]